jgi:hypothetical protein
VRGAIVEQGMNRSFTASKSPWFFLLNFEELYFIIVKAVTRNSQGGEQKKVN